MDLRRLQYFVAVAEELHFGRAADRLHMAQPPLSRQIQRLETELGTQLLVRDRHRVELTCAGSALLPEARATLAQAARAEEAVHQAVRGDEGMLDVGFIASVAFSLLSDLTRHHRDACPGVRLRLHDMSTGEQLRALRERRLDVGLMMRPTSAPQLNVETLLAEPLVLVVPPAHRLAGAEGVRLAELEDEQFVMFPRADSPDLHDRLVHVCAEAGFVPRVSQEATHMSTIACLVAGGAGVALLPESIRRVDRHDVSCVTLAEEEIKAWLALAWPRGDSPAPLPAFLDTVRAVAGVSPATD